MPFSLILSGDGTIVWRHVGEGASGSFGIPAAEIVRDGALLTDRMRPSDRTRFTRALADVADRPALLREDVRLTVAGDERCFEFLAAREIGDGDGAVWHGLATDVTEGRRGEEALHLTQFSFDHASIAIFRIDEEDGRIVAANQQACRSLGYTAEELCSMSVFDIDPTFTPERWHEHRRQVRRARSGTVESFHRRKDGSVFPVEVAVSYFEYAGREYSFSFARDVTERRRVESALRAEEAKYRSVVDNVGIGIVLIDREMKVQSVNRALRERFPEVDFESCPICYHVFRVPPRDWPCDHCVTAETFADGEVHETVTEVQLGGKRNFFRVISSPVKGDDGKVAAVVELVEDITERLQAEHDRERLEAQLRQAAKMESIGTLAGGIAHDFNNMLGVIIGYAALMKDSVAADDPLLHSICEIEKAALHSRDITSRLLAFSRRQTISPRSLDVGRHVAALQPTLRRLIGENYQLTLSGTADPWTVRFDPSQLDQILVNLVVNARDAMPDGGAIAIELANVSIPGDDGTDSPAGEYLSLRVSDEGVGMTDETLARIFEPFFTTKGAGRGTGLGLSMVYGIVEQNGGWTDVCSRPGAGTTFTVHLPRVANAPAPRIQEPAWAAGGLATILLVEDDPLVRRLAAEMLGRLGHTVLIGETPQAALAICETEGQAIDLLLTDVIMPDMDGATLRDRVQAIRPRIKVLFMSGYPADVIGRHGVLDPDVAFLQKPFDLRGLARAVVEVLSRA